MLGDPNLIAPPVENEPDPGPRPTFSVIVATYQGAGTIVEAIRSAAQQTEPPLEIVVCDDGSTDNTADVLHALATQLNGSGPALRIIEQANAGESTAKNNAAAAATGDFVVILDADDVWDPRRLERMGDLVQARPDLDLVTTDAWMVFDGVRRGVFSDGAGAFPAADQKTEILQRCFFFAHVAVRRSVWLAHGGFSTEVSYAADWDCWLRLIWSGSLAGCVAEPLADYTIHGSSLSANRSASLTARVQILDRAAQMQALDRDELRVLETSRARHLRRARVATAENALMKGTDDAANAARAVATTPGVTLPLRALAAAASVAPKFAGRVLRFQASRRGHASTDRAVPAAPRSAG